VNAVKYMRVYTSYSFDVDEKEFMIYTSIMYTAAFVEMSKYVISDVVNYFFYFIAIDLYSNLANSVTDVLDSADTKKIGEWLELHHFCDKYYI
jgi:hypothetical protein